MQLTVTQAFGGRSVGETISDAEEVEAILASDHAHYVVAVPGAEPLETAPKE